MVKVLDKVSGDLGLIAGSARLLCDPGQALCGSVSVYNTEIIFPLCILSNYSLRAPGQELSHSVCVCLSNVYHNGALIKSAALYANVIQINNNISAQDMSHIKRPNTALIYTDVQQYNQKSLISIVTPELPV